MGTITMWLVRMVRFCQMTVKLEMPLGQVDIVLDRYNSTPHWSYASLSDSVVAGADVILVLHLVLVF